MQNANTLKVILTFVSLSLLLSLLQNQSLAAPSFANSNFRQLWEYSDKLVDEVPNSGRGFTWGPNSFAVLQEDYAEGIGGKRQVQYFDKSRMELSPDGRTVTNGLLTKELVTGQQQVGNNAFVSRPPSTTPVAGDSNNATAPTYASFKNVITSQPGENTAPARTNQIVNSAVDKAGNVSTLTNLPAQITIAYYEPLLGHNVPTVFLDYQNLIGRIWNGASYINGRVYTDNPTANVFGLPISEPFWLRAVVGGVEKDILTQLFERRILTYTPSNPDPFKVEMGNIGQHYYQWRYAGSAPPKTPARITFWYGLSGELGTVVEELVARYNRSQNFYTVTAVQQTNYDETITRFNSALAGGSLPNLVQIYDIGLQRMIDTKHIIPMQNLIERDNFEIINDFEPAVKSYYTIGNRLYSMPFNSSVPLMYFDKKAFREVGLDPEKRIWTYDELADAARKLIRRNGNSVNRYGVGFTSYSWIFEQQLATQDALFAEPNNGREVRATNLVFNNSAGENWLNLIKNLSSEEVVTFYGNETSNAGRRDNDFLNGRTSIVFNSSALLRSYLNQSAGRIELGVAYLPRPSGAKGGVAIGGASLWITDQGTSAQQEAAWDFVQWLSQPETQAYWSSRTGYYPVRKAAYDLKEMQDFISQVPQFQIAVDQLRATQPSFATQGAVFGTFTSARQEIEAAINSFITGSRDTAKAALDEAARRANTTLQQYNSSIK
jgi:sn-glycerol 3-phosphate transport system substrate-binding protein